MKRTEKDNQRMRDQIVRTVQLIRDYDALRRVAQYASKVLVDTEYNGELLIQE